MAYDEKTAERVRRALSHRRDVVEKKLMGGLCFMVKGGMCCSVSGRGGLLIRVGVDAQELFPALTLIRSVGPRINVAPRCRGYNRAAAVIA